MTTMTFKQFLGNKIKKYDYSSLLIELPDELTDSIISWGFDNVPDEHLFFDPNDPTFGREDDIHLTLIYGIHADNPKEIKSIIKEEKSFTCKLGEIKLLTKNSKFDVLVIDVQCDNLHNLNKKLHLSLDVTKTHPEFIPHVTIAYLKKNIGKKYVGDKTFDGEQFHVKNFKFSSKNGNQINIELKGK